MFFFRLGLAMMAGGTRNKQGNEQVDKEPVRLYIKQRSNGEKPTIQQKLGSILPYSTFIIDLSHT